MPIVIILIEVMKKEEESLVLEVIHSILGLTSEKLYLMVSDQTPKDIPNAFYFNVDDLIVQTCRIWSTSPT